MGFVKFLTVNCQGLGNIEKRKDVFPFLKSKNYDIYCLQDTHFTSEIEKNDR
jgi:exonuclease III